MLKMYYESVGIIERSSFVGVSKLDDDGNCLTRKLALIACHAAGRGIKNSGEFLFDGLWRWLLAVVEI